MDIRHEIGKRGEDIAKKLLLQKGYEIIQTNYKCCFGEIDIIAKDRDYLVFIEVKTRTNIRYGGGSSSIDKIKQKHIYKSAQYYINR